MSIYIHVLTWIIVVTIHAEHSKSSGVDFSEFHVSDVP